MLIDSSVAPVYEVLVKLRSGEETSAVTMVRRQFETCVAAVILVVPCREDRYEGEL